jgi:hypothetical protein
MTIGADSFVSQPSTGIWNPNTMTIEIQYAGLRKSPVRSTPNSNAQTAITAITAGIV